MPFKYKIATAVIGSNDVRFVDLNCFKYFFVLSDWLLDRRHCNIKWQGKVKTVREKINAAIQDMPENEEIKQLLSGSCKFLMDGTRISVSVSVANDMLLL